MGENDVMMQLLGRIDGKLDQVIESAKEHREDDKRRFTEVHKKIDDHEKDISEAKGATGVIRWLVCGGLVAIGTSLAAIAKAFGKL